MHFASYVQAAWPVLKAKQKIWLPVGTPHPYDLGFNEVDGWPGDHVQSWGYSLSDGSRLHALVFANGAIQLHWDRWDPNHSLGHRILHGLFETPIGPVTALATVGYLTLRD